MERLAEFQDVCADSTPEGIGHMNLMFYGLEIVVMEVPTNQYGPGQSDGSGSAKFKSDGDMSPPPPLILT